MTDIIRMRRRTREVIELREPPDGLQLAELYAMRRDALDRGDVQAAEAIDEQVQELMDRID